MVIVTFTHLKTKLFLIGLGVGKGERMLSQNGYAIEIA